MPMHTRVIGKDTDGNDVVEAWGDDLNWAHGVMESGGEKREYYRAHGRGNAYYAVMREISDKLDRFNKPEFKYWYVSMHVDGKTTHMPTEFMNAYEGQEVCQIFESERTHEVSKNEHVRIEGKNDGSD